MAVSDIYFLEVSADVSKKVVTKNPFRDKKRLWKFRFLGYFSNVKTEECNQKDRGFYNKFRLLMVGSDIYFLDMSVHVTLKEATNNFFRDNETL